MSLDDGQRRATGEQLRANLATAGLSEEQLAAYVGVPHRDVAAALSLGRPGDETVDPRLPWVVRDFLVQVISDHGGEPVPFTVLTEAARPAAQAWFGHWDVPPTPRG